MAISLVAGIVGNFTQNGADDTIDLSSGPPQEGDVVIVFGGHGNSVATVDPPVGDNSGAYTAIAEEEGGTLACGSWYQVMGATPDTEVVCDGGGNAADAVTYVVYILRGVDTSNVLDAAVVELGPAAGNNPDPSAITTVTNGAWVIVFLFSDLNETGWTVSTGYGNQLVRGGNDTVDCSAHGQTRLKSSAGVEDPDAVSFFSANNHYVQTVAIRPLPSDGVGKGGPGLTFGMMGRMGKAA